MVAQSSSSSGASLDLVAVLDELDRDRLAGLSRVAGSGDGGGVVVVAELEVEGHVETRRELGREVAHSMPGSLEIRSLWTCSRSRSVRAVERVVQLLQLRGDGSALGLDRGLVDLVEERLPFPRDLRVDDDLHGASRRLVALAGLGDVAHGESFRDRPG
jgi:hypothetical protein